MWFFACVEGAQCAPAKCVCIVGSGNPGITHKMLGHNRPKAYKPTQRFDTVTRYDTAYRSSGDFQWRPMNERGTHSKLRCSNWSVIPVIPERMAEWYDKCSLHTNFYDCYFCATGTVTYKTENYLLEVNIRFIRDMYQQCVQIDSS